MNIFFGTVYSDVQDKLDTLGNPWSTVQSLNNLIPGLFNIAITMGMVVFIFTLLIGGIKWITAGGDKEATMKAQKTITSAVVGLVFVFFIYAILKFLEYFFGINLIVIDLEPLILK